MNSEVRAAMIGAVVGFLGSALVGWIGLLGAVADTTTSLLSHQEDLAAALVVAATDSSRAASDRALLVEASRAADVAGRLEDWLTTYGSELEAEVKKEAAQRRWDHLASVLADYPDPEGRALVLEHADLEPEVDEVRRSYLERAQEDAERERLQRKGRQLLGTDQMQLIVLTKGAGHPELAHQRIHGTWCHTVANLGDGDAYLGVAGQNACTGSPRHCRQKLTPGMVWTVQSTELQVWGPRASGGPEHEVTDVASPVRLAVARCTQ